MGEREDGEWLSLLMGWLGSGSRARMEWDVVEEDEDGKW